MDDHNTIEARLITILREHGGTLTIDARTQPSYAMHLDRMAFRGTIECMENGYPKATYRLYAHQLQFHHDRAVVWEQAGQTRPATVVRTNRKHVQILFRDARGAAKLCWVAPHTLRLADTE